MSRPSNTVGELLPFQQLIKDINDVPPGLSIATMTITGEFDTKFNVENIGKYVDLNLNEIVTVKYGDGPNEIRTLLKKPKQGKRKKKSKRNFNNQCTMKIRVGKDKKGKPKHVSLKIFVNGSFQIAGCCSIANISDSLLIVGKNLRVRKATMIGMNPKSFTLRPFATNPDSISLYKLKSAKIGMINSSFRIEYKVNRENLHSIMNNRGIENRYEPMNHACVNIKYNHEGRKPISIFVFESGAVIITGARTGNHVAKAYEFIQQIFNTHRHEIIKHDLKSYLDDPMIVDLINDTPLEAFAGENGSLLNLGMSWAPLKLKLSSEPASSDSTSA